MPIEVVSLTGDEINPVLPALAKLRIVVFRDWPYLYDGTIAYEETYLAKFAAAKGAVCVVARDGDEVVGASTAAPMIEHADEFAEPFEKAGYDLNKIFYCGESVLLKSHRGQGVYPDFFARREAHARKLGGFTHATFCRVVRPNDHPLKPADYRPLDGIWTKFGYAPVEGIVAARASDQLLCIDGSPAPLERILLHTAPAAIYLIAFHLNVKKPRYIKGDIQ